MIATGIFMFLLGTKIGRIAAIHSDVKYEPSRIAIREQIDQSPILVPDLGPPPYLPNFVHQGSNYFFGTPFPIPPGPMPPVPPAVETIVTQIQDEDCDDVKMVSKPVVSEFFVQEPRKPMLKNPIIKVKEIVPSPKLSLPLPDISLNLKPIPQLPSIPIPIINSQLISQLTAPLNAIKIPGLKLKTGSNLPMLIEEPVLTPADCVISEVDVEIKKIPPPPQLPPLILEDIIRPVIVEEKKVILIPSRPEIQTILPPSVVVSDRPCSPTVCAQNIVFERILPNICEKFKSVELISLPAATRFPVVSTSLLPFVKK